MAEDTAALHFPVYLYSRRVLPMTVVDLYNLFYIVTHVNVIVTCAICHKSKSVEYC